MLSYQSNITLTRVGPGTPMGEVFRRYWLPVMLSEELPTPDCPPARVRLLGEDLLAFRDTNNRIGLVDAYCPHRQVPLFFGRNEECGLRCVYHGWKFDIEGKCVDMPNEPAGSNYKNKIKLKSYPTFEAADVIWTYMGPEEEMPPTPDYEWMRVSKGSRHVSRTFENCNFMQALEGGIDTSHSSFAHNNDITNNTLIRSRDLAPKLEVEKTDYGFRYFGIRNLGDDGNYVRAYQFIMPSQQMRGFMVPKGKKTADFFPTIHGHIWVPVDDESCYVYNWLYSSDGKTTFDPDWIDNLETKMGRGPNDFLPGYPPFRLKKNASNDYMIDREVQRTKTFTGIEGINTQDFALQEGMRSSDDRPRREGMGSIVDRTREHLGTADVAIIAARQLLLEAAKHVEEKQKLRGINPGTYRDVRAADMIIPQGVEWRKVLQEHLSAIF